MKCILKLALAFATLCLPAPAQISLHAQAGMTDAYVRSYVEQEPDIPGMGKVIQKLAVSFSNTDPNAYTFNVYMRVTLEDGTFEIINRVVSKVYLQNTVVRVTLPAKPVSVTEFYIHALYPGPTDYIVQPAAN